MAQASPAPADAPVEELTAEEEEITSALDLPAAPRPPLDEREIALDQIAVRENIRPVLHGIQGLAETMHTSGQLLPCVVRPTPQDAGHDKPFELIFGHRRMAAAELLEWETLRCEVRDIPEERRIVQMTVENFQREDLSPVAKARIMYEIKHSSSPPQSNAQIARLLGCDPSQVSHLLKMLQALAPPEPPQEGDEEEEASTFELAPVSTPPEQEENLPATQESAEVAQEPQRPAARAPEKIDILAAVDEGRISGSTAEVIASLEQDDDKQQLAKLVLKNDWGVKKAASWAREVKERDHRLEEGPAEMGVIEMIEIADVTELPHLRPRPDLTPEEISRVILYAQLRNGMDQEVLDYLLEQLGYSYEQLWQYVTALSSEEVTELTERLAIRYISAAHRFFDFEPELKDDLGLPDDAPDSHARAAAELAALNLPVPADAAQETERPALPEAQ